MTRPVRTLVLATMLLAAALPARGGGGRFSAGLTGSITTASKLFTNPYARDEILRGTYIPVDPVWGAGLDLRTLVPAFGLRFGIAAEYLAASVTSSAPNTSPAVPIEDGYAAVPLELTAFFSLPVGGDPVDFYMGGGAGVYFGERRYNYAGVSAQTIERKPQAGIHVLTGIEYSLGETVSLRTEVRFRNVQLETTQRFPVPSTVWEGMTVPLPAEPFASRVQVDGMNLNVGLVFRFP